MERPRDDTHVQTQAMEHREAALRLVEHWKKEAERQAQFAQVPPLGLNVHACLRATHCLCCNDNDNRSSSKLLARRRLRMHRLLAPRRSARSWPRCAQRMRAWGSRCCASSFGMPRISFTAALCTEDRFLCNIMLPNFFLQGNSGCGCEFHKCGKTGAGGGGRPD